MSCLCLSSVLPLTAYSRTFFIIIFNTYSRQFMVRTCKISKEKEAVMRAEHEIFRADHRLR